MKRLNFDAFLALPWSDNVRTKLKAIAERDDLHSLVATNLGAKLAASAFTEPPNELADNVVAIWVKPRPRPAGVTKTQEALDLLEATNLTPYAAALLVGIHHTAVYRALERAKTKPLCPCCGQVVREGFTVKVPSRGQASS